VAFFHARPHLRDDLSEALANTEDATRIVQKFLLGRGDLGDLSAISSTISVWSSIRKRIELEKEMEFKEKGDHDSRQWLSIDALLSHFDDLHDLSRRISMALRKRCGTYENLEVPSITDAEANTDSSDRNRTAGQKWSIRPE
jgi:DNA mismatch repair ATPase MutS